MIKLTIGRRVKVMVPSLAVAVAVYDRTRDESGEGASTFPDATAQSDSGKKYRISYNGRLWDGDTPVNPCVS